MQENEEQKKPLTATTLISWLLALGLIVTGAMVTQQLDEQNRRPTCVLTARQRTLQAERWEPLPAKGKAIVRKRNRYAEPVEPAEPLPVAKPAKPAETDEKWLVGIIEEGIK